MSVTKTGPGQPVIDRILAEVAEAEDCEKLDLPPLYEAIDPDALRKLVERDAELTISFFYNRYKVTFETPDEIVVALKDDILQE